MEQLALLDSVDSKWKPTDMVLSVSHEQTQILSWIMRLHNKGEPFDVDCTYSTGVFYKNLPQPTRKFDLVPQAAGVEQADARHLPLEDESVGSIVFDPPFLIKNVNRASVTGIIELRFSGYPTLSALHDFYRDALVEFRRVLKPGGIVVFKCQDQVSAGRQVWSHCYVYETAHALGYKTGDLFVLTSRSVIWTPSNRNQQHARKAHSFLWVLRKPVVRRGKVSTMEDSHA